MPKNSLNASLKGADDIFSTEESGKSSSGNRCSRFP